MQTRWNDRCFGQSKDGHVRAVVVGGEVTELLIDPGWRSASQFRDVERSVIQAVNQAIDAWLAEVNTAIAEIPNRTDLADVARTASVELSSAPGSTSLASAMDQLVDVLSSEAPSLGADQPERPRQVSIDSPHCRATVHLTDGRLAGLGVDPHWDRQTDDAGYAQAIVATINQALHTDAALALESLVSSVGGARGRESELYEAQAYVASGLQMDWLNAARSNA